MDFSYLFIFFALPLWGSEEVDDLKVLSYDTRVIDGPLKCQPEVLKTIALGLINHSPNGYIKLLETNIIYGRMVMDAPALAFCCLLYTSTSAGLALSPAAV